MSKIENVQRKYTKHIKGLFNLNYEDRLEKIKLPSMEYRQIRGDMIQVFKIAKNYYDPKSTANIFQFNQSTRLRGHIHKIDKKFTNKSKHRNFFTNRVTLKWNSLPSSLMEAKSINEFKNKFDALNKDIMYSTNICYFD